MPTKVGLTFALLNLLCHAPLGFPLRGRLLTFVNECLDIQKLPSNALHEWVRLGLCPDIGLTYRMCQRKKHIPDALLYVPPYQRVPPYPPSKGGQGGC